jgi:RNA polymerase sigma-70 factor (ECF subfamily)
VFRIARNLHFDELRAAKARGGTHAELDAAADYIGADGLRIVEARSDLGAAAQAFAALPEAQRETFVLVALEGLSYREAAELLEVPIGTIMSRLARARAVMESRINGATGDGNDPRQR